MNMQEIGLRISTMRKQKDMTQVELADKMNVSYQAVSSWERGLTMPDISKLPDISQVLGATIDELLGDVKQAEMVKNVLTNNTEQYVAETEIHAEDLTDVAPILKPSQVNNLAESVKKIEMRDIIRLAPFLNRDVLRHLVAKAEDTGDMDTISSLAPFLDKDTLDEMAAKIEEVDGLKGLRRLAPFLGEKTLARLAMKAKNKNDIDGLKAIAPFLKSDTVDELARSIEDIGGIDAIRRLFPFLSKAMASEMASKAINVGDMKGLRHLAPFIDSDLLGKLVLESVDMENIPRKTTIGDVTVIGDFTEN
ncbi:MAG: helix-turn-helix domain-containing protein [Defluviitaleaceae bacterium]|nr:helix-turn-helix domain-containing protein [Defluviitaleaceae bacterium]